MIKFLLNLISQSLGYSKVESRGTLVLTLLVISLFGLSHFATGLLKEKEPEIDNSLALKAWVKEVKSSYRVKKNKNERVVVDDIIKKTPPILRKASPRKIEAESPKKIIRKDINISTAKELQQIKGIGKVYSERIIKYRDLLGGFYDINQLNEVYGLKPELIEQITSNFYVQAEVTPIDFNTDSAKILASHPYVSYDLAWIIINFRKQHGDIRSFDDLNQIKAIDDSLIAKLKPYLY